MKNYIYKIIIFIIATIIIFEFTIGKHINQFNEKVEYLMFFFTDVNSSQKEIKVPFWCQKASHFDRCTHRGFMFLHIFHSF